MDQSFETTGKSETGEIQADGGVAHDRLLESIPRLDVLGSRVDAISYDQLWALISAWSRRPEAHRVCLAGIPSILFTHDDPEYREAHGSADLVLPDGMPLVWHVRHAGYPSQERLDGPNLVYRLCADAERQSIPVGFYGSTPETVDQIRRNILERYPRLDLRLCRDAPFPPTTDEQEADEVDHINQSGARIVFVGLSCPKQEKWMGRQADRLMATSIGVGGAFDVIAGTFSLPPMWVQQSGLQWLYRLAQEPRRLWRRYFSQNIRYLGLLVGSRIGRKPPSSHRSR